MSYQLATHIDISHAVIDSIRQHACRLTQTEVAGFLVGPQPKRIAADHYRLHVTDYIIARYTRNRKDSVTFTADTWREFHTTMADRYQHTCLQMLGWYHTHPGYGIFLSDHDLSLHTGFYTQPWHIALVLDPKAQTEGLFCWDVAKRSVHPYAFRWPQWPNS